MRWEQNVCPTCGEPVWGVVNQITALVEPAQEVGDASYNWVGETDLDTQCELVDDEGREQLVCDAGHIWWSRPVDYANDERLRSSE